MKQAKFLATLCVLGSMFFILSCNSGDDKKTTDTPSDTSTSKMETPPPPPSSPSGPSNVMIIKHKLANYAKWKPMYESHDSVREASGLHNYLVARGVDDSNMVMVVLKMDDTAKAKAFSANPAVRNRMKTAGVMSMPSMDYVETVMNDTTAISQSIRLMINISIKDWYAWKKVFDDDKPARVAAGLTDRALGHTAGDTHKVTIVFAVGDLAKAKEFIASKALKDKMMASGVVGPPSFYFYKIAAKY